MAKILFDAPYPLAGQNLNNPAPTVERYTVATLPDARQSSGRGKCALVTDSTATTTGGVGIAPTGGGSNLQLVWNTGQAWIGV